MPQPTPGDVHVDQMLTGFSVAFVQGNQAQQYIADKVFPTVPVAQQSNKYRYYPRSAWFRTIAGKRGPSSETPGGGWTYSADSYYCDVWGVHKDVDDQERANADSDLSLDTDATNWVTDQLLLRRELEWADRYFKTGVWATDLTGVASNPSTGQFLQWNQAASTPIQDVRDKAIAMQKLTGLRPNVLVIGPEVETVLLNHPQIIDRIKYTREGTYDYQLLARLLGVDRLVTANAVVNTGAETATETEWNSTTGVAHADADDTDNFGFVFGKNALLCYAAPNAGQRTVSAGYTFAWSGLYGTAAYGGRIKRYRQEQIASDRIEGEAAWSMKVIAPDLGVFWSGLVA